LQADTDDACGHDADLGNDAHVDPFSGPDVADHADTEAAPSAEDDLLTAAAETNSMEAGDEEYKNLIAESQMDNIFN
jgi:hypothetical protein